MYISGRERKMLDILLHAHQEVTVTLLAQRLEVSQRTVHRDLKNAEKTLSKYNLSVKKKTGVGILLLGDDQDKDQLMAEINRTRITDYTLDERQAIILSTLLESDEPVKLFFLASELQVSNATVSNDLDGLQETIDNFDLKLIRRRGYGVEIVGSEASKRAIASDLISHFINPFEFVTLVKESLKKESPKVENFVSDRLLGLVDGEKLSIIEKVVETESSHLPYHLADNAHVGLIVHLALAIERIQKGDSIQFDSAYLQQISGTREYTIAKQMIVALESELSITIPKGELGYIVMHLLGAKHRVNQDYVLESPSVEIAQKVYTLVEYMSKHLQVDLEENTVLLHDLTTHLKPTIYRLQHRMNIKNPLMDEIKRDYSDLFNITKNGVEEVFSYVDFPDSEIAYIVLHFAAAILSNENTGLKALVICASGIGTAKILSTNLMRQIPEIEEVDHQSMFDLKKLDVEDYDLVISTVVLNDFSDYILASPILSKEEVSSIQSFIRKKRLTNPKRAQLKKVKPPVDNLEQQAFHDKLEQMQGYATSILQLLDTFNIEQITPISDISEVLKAICMTLEEKTHIKSYTDVYNNLLEREMSGGLGIPGSRLALYHTRTKGVIQPVFNIYSLKSPVPVKGMDGKEVEITRIILMLSSMEPPAELLQVFSLISESLIRDEKSLSLFEKGDYIQIKHYLIEQFQQLLQS